MKLSKKIPIKIASVAIIVAVTAFIVLSESKGKSLDRNGIIHKKKINREFKHTAESDRKKHYNQNTPAVECKDIIFNEFETIGYSSYQTFDSDIQSPESILTAYYNGEQSDGINQLKKLIEATNYQDIAAVQSLHEIYMDKSMIEEGIKLLRQAIEANETNNGLLLNLAQSLELSNEGRITHEAESITLKLLEKEPHNLDALQTYKAILMNDDRGDEYSEYMMETIMSNPHDSALDIELASTYLEKGNMDMAESVYLNALEKNPNDIDLKRAFADLLATEGKYTDAIDSYTNYITEAPTDPYGFIQLAELYFKIGDNYQGRIYYDRAMTLTNES